MDQDDLRRSEGLRAKQLRATESQHVTGQVAPTDTDNQSSCGSISSSARRRLIEARRARELAELEIEQLAASVNAQRALVEARYEEEQAQLEIEEERTISSVRRWVNSATTTCDVTEAATGACRSSHTIPVRLDEDFPVREAPVDSVMPVNDSDPPIREAPVDSVMLTKDSASVDCAIRIGRDIPYDRVNSEPKLAVSFDPTAQINCFEHTRYYKCDEQSVPHNIGIPIKNAASGVSNYQRYAGAHCSQHGRDCHAATGALSGEIEDLARAITAAVRTAIPPAAPVPSPPPVSVAAQPAVAEKLLARLSAKDLPTFTGDPIEWLRFKNAFETTTKIGQYSEAENVARLQRCLHGEAWDAVAARVITASSAEEIKKILELRFGRPDLVLSKLLDDMKSFPNLTGSRQELIMLATKVSNCVSAIKATNRQEYLYSPELEKAIVSKFTENLIYRWMDYCALLDANFPRLSALSDYLLHEAEHLCITGVVEVPSAIKLTKSPPSNSVNAVSDLSKGQTVICCLYCDKNTHVLDNCSLFQAEDLNKRWSWVCSQKLCFKCLSPKHRRLRCRSKKQCAVCKRGHHSLLHRDDFQNSAQANPEAASDGGRPAVVCAPASPYVAPRPCVADATETTANTWANTVFSKQVYLKVLPVSIEGPSGSVRALALFDEGSTISLVDRHIARAVGAEGAIINLNLQGAIGESCNMSSQVVALNVRTSTGLYTLDRVRTVENLTLPMQKVDATVLSRYCHLQNVPLETYEGRPVLLIGQDYWHLIISREVRQGNSDDPVASRTMLGWVLHGFVSSISQVKLPDFSFHVHHSEADRELHELVKNYFHIDSLGVKSSEKEEHSTDDQRAMQILETKSRKVKCNHSEHWETGLLWRSDAVILPNNKKGALHRLMIVEKMMDADPAFAADYTKQVDTMLQRGYAQEVQNLVSGDRLWYLPHFGVRNPNKPGKLRLVFDAKAETKGYSLNTELLTGPDLFNSLNGVLMRFRERAVAVTGDIKEMFLRVKINEEDQKSQMFLWRGDERQNPPRTYKMTSMIFGAKSSPCTATYIIRKNADMFTESYPRAVKAIKERHYVDDYLDSVDSEEEMKQLLDEVIMIHLSGGFEIRGFASNKPSCLPKESSIADVSLFGSENVQRTLGMIWKTQQDVLGFDLTLKKIDKEVAEGLRRPTKRDVLKVIMSVFDPLGFLSPFMIRGKILMQDIWRSGVQWDEQIGASFAKIWFDWLRELKACQDVSRFCVPRCYAFSQLNNLELHVFVDASEQAYCAVAYFRRVGGEVAFIAAKSRVAPLKSTTIPRLELQAALLGTRLGVGVQKEQDIEIASRYFWTDSSAVWHWTQGNTTQKDAFISNRLSEIRGLTRASEWRWLPGDLNVADEATRSRVISDPKWINGPDFLRLSEEQWPVIQAPNPDEFENYSENNDLNKNINVNEHQVLTKNERNTLLNASPIKEVRSKNYYQVL